MTSRLIVVGALALCLVPRAVGAQVTPTLQCACLQQAQQHIPVGREIRVRVKDGPSVTGRLDTVVVAGMTPGICFWPRKGIGNHPPSLSDPKLSGDTLGVIAERVRNGAIFVPYGDISAIQYRIGDHVEPLVLVALGTLAGAVIGSLATPRTTVCGTSGCHYERQRTGWTARGAVIGAAAGLVLSTILRPTRTIRCW